MAPRRIVNRKQPARVAREAVNEAEQQAVPPPVAPPVDQDALRQMVQDAARQAAQEAVNQVAQEAARQAAQEAARVVAEELVRQMAADQQTPPVQAQQNQHAPAQQIPVHQVAFQPEFQGPLPPPPPGAPQGYPIYDERFHRLTSQMRNMEMEHFRGTVDPTAAYDWKLSLQRNLEIIDCPAELSLRLTMQYLRGDALVWWEGIRLNHYGGRLTFGDFMQEFDRKYFPKEAMDKKKCDFEHVSQGSKTIREYEVEFSRLRRFAGGGFSEEDLIRKFLSGMRVDIRNRCRVVTYHRLGDLVEKAAEQEAGLEEEQRLTKSAQTKYGKGPESYGRLGDSSSSPLCRQCHRRHSGPCRRCHNCGQMGHHARDCRVRPRDATPIRQFAAPVAPVAAARNCFNCNQPGHVFKDCPRRVNAALPPPPKRPAIAPRVFAVGDHQGAEPIAGMRSFIFVMLKYFGFVVIMCS